MKKYIKWILLGVAITIGVFLVKLPSIVQNIAVKRLEIILGRKVSSGEVKYNYPKNILYMNNFKVFEEDGSSVFIAFESLNVNIDIVPLLKKTFYVRELTFVKPNIKIDYKNGVANYQSILNKLEESEKTDTKIEESGNSEGFINSYQLKNIAIESFTLFYEDRVITASNNFTLKTPSSTYKDGIFTLDSTLDFYDKGNIKLDLEYNDIGNFKGSLTATNLLLDDKLYITKTLYDLSTVEGTLSTTLNIEGNTKNNDYTIIGDIEAHRLKVSSDKQGELFKVGKFKTNLDLSTKENKYHFKGIEATDGSIDTDKILAFLDDLSKKNEGKENTEDTLSKEELDLNIDSAKFRDIDVTTKVGNFTSVEALLNNFTGRKEDEVSLDLSFIYNDKTKIKINSKNKLLDGLNFATDTISSKGKLSLEGESIHFIDTFLSKEREYDIDSGAINYSGQYSYSYPKVDISSVVSVNNMALNNFTTDYNKISTELLSSNNDFYYNLEDSSYKISGDIDLNTLIVGTSEDKVFISTNSLLGKVKEVSANNFALESLDLTDLIIDLTKLPAKIEDNNTATTSSDYPAVTLDSLTLKNSKLIHKDFNLGINLNASNIGTLKGNSQIDFRGTYNNSPVTIKGRLRRNRNLKTTKEFDYITFNGNSNIRDFDLDYLNKYTDNKYKLSGNLNISSQVSYSKDNISTQNKIDSKNITLKLDESDLTVKQLNSDNKLNIKNGSYLFSGDLIYTDSTVNTGSMKSSLAKGEILINSITPKEVIIESLSLTGPRISLTDDKEDKNTAPEKEVDVDKIVQKEEAKAEDNKEEKVHITIKKINIKEGRIDYIATNIRYHIKNIIVNIDNFTTKKAQEFGGKMSGDLTGVGSIHSEFTSSLERDWDFSLTSLNIDGKFDIKDLNLLDFKKYLETKLPNEVTSGKFNYTGDIKLEKGKFKGENIFLINTVYIGKETPVESAIPLKLAVGILRDRKGNLKLDVPVSGDFNDPKFKLSRVVLQAVKNILIKAVTSPVNILSKAFNLGDDEALSLDYNYLEIKPKSGDATLKKIGDILKEKRNISVVFTIFTNTDEEKTVLNESIKKDKLFKRDTKNEKLEEKLTDIMLSRKTYIENYFDRALLSRRIRVEVSDIPRDTPRANIDIIVNQ